MGNMCCSQAEQITGMPTVIEQDYGKIFMSQDFQNKQEIEHPEISDEKKQKQIQHIKLILRQIMKSNTDLDSASHQRIIQFVVDNRLTIWGHLGNNSVKNINVVRMKPENHLNKNKQSIDYNRSIISTNRYLCGSFSNGKVEGLALYYCEGFYYYIGHFIKGLAHGHGVLTYVSGHNNLKITQIQKQEQYEIPKKEKGNQYEEYSGNFLEGKAHGHGRYHKKYLIKNQGRPQQKIETEISFDGQWLIGMPVSGSVTFGLNSPIRYIQILDIKTREGIIYLRNGGKYKGHMNQKLEPSGIGNYTSPPYKMHGKIINQQYDGQWLEGKYHGYGRFFWKNGSSYEGNYCFGKKQGQGKYTYQSKSYYIGQWLQGKQNGRGILYNKTGKITKKGLWNNGQYKLQIPDNEWNQTSKVFNNFTSQ